MSVLLLTQTVCPSLPESLKFTVSESCLAALESKAEGIIIDGNIFLKDTKRQGRHTNTYKKKRLYNGE